MVKRIFLNLLPLFLVISIVSHASSSDISLENDDISVVIHEKRNGSEFFPSEENYTKDFFNFNNNNQNFGNYTKVNLDSAINSVIFQLKKFIILEKIPNCRRSQTRETQVYANSLESTSIDFIFYNPKRFGEIEKARNKGDQAIEYRAGESFGLSTESSSKDQSPIFAMMANIECLPTRIRFISQENGKRYLEYREGDKAWE